MGWTNMRDAPLSLIWWANSGGVYEELASVGVTPFESRPKNTIGHASEFGLYYVNVGRK